MNIISLNIELNNKEWEKSLPDFEEISNLITSKTFDFINENEDIDFLKLNKKINISLSLSNDENIQELNKHYRDIDKPTNVLSFSSIDDETFYDELKLFPDIELGDIIISLDTLTKEALEKKISLKDHFSHLLIHGILHLLGFDHIEDDEAEYMEDFEVQILKTLNINNPYTE